MDSPGGDLPFVPQFAIVKRRQNGSRKFFFKFFFFFTMIFSEYFRHPTFSIRPQEPLLFYTQYYCYCGLVSVLVNCTSVTYFRPTILIYVVSMCFK